ncbi:MAG: hypothetical protein NDI93_01400 [Pseudomonas sp.]|nr:hypothetical protein [Pseudomonas sp.]
MNQLQETIGTVTMTKAQRRLSFHESFEALVQTLGEVLPAEQRTAAQQQLLEDAEFQVNVLRSSEHKLNPIPIRTIERRAARHARMLADLAEAFRTGAVTIRSVTP